MSNTIIKIGGLGKKYIISHESKERYTALRDVISGSAKKLIRKKEEKVLTKEEFWALKDVSFDIKQGEAVGIIGRNGAGKSTLLKILSRITEPSAGHIEMNGRIASLLEVGTGFHPELTGRENIFLNGAILGMSRIEIKRKFDEIVDFSGVEKFLDTPVKRYSSGMYVRLAFSVAAHLEPEILVVDEVLAVGDAEFQKKCLGKMSEVSRGEGRTVLFVSHNINAIQQLCNKGVVLHKGQLLFFGEVEEAIQKYNNSGEKDEIKKASFQKDNIKENAISILEASIEKNDGHKSIIFSLEENIVLIIKYCVNKPVTGGILNFIISDPAQELFMSFDTDKSAELFTERKEGEFLAKVIIPKERLKPGSYSVSIGSGIANRNAIEQINDCLSFEIVPEADNYLFASYYKDRRGIVPMITTWQTRPIN